MKTIVGLGNPGPEYERTRHNVGRNIVAALGKHFAADPFKQNKKYKGLAAKGVIGKEKVFFLLPDTFMNRSGKALAALGPKPKDLIVIHDDSDLELGVLKVSFGKNSAGHKGVESVMRALKSKNFWRIRIGIQKKRRVSAMELVLQKLKPDEERIVKKLEKKIFEILEEGGLRATTVSCL